MTGTGDAETAHQPAADTRRAWAVRTEDIAFALPWIAGGSATLLASAAAAIAGIVALGAVSAAPFLTGLLYAVAIGAFGTMICALHLIAWRRDAPGHGSD